MFNTFATFALVGAVSAIDQTQFEFMSYVAQYGKTYASLDEFNMRYEIFAKNDEIIKTHNADPTETHVLGHNFLSDYTEAEKAKLRGLKGEPKTNGQKLVSNGAPIPNAVDWVTAGKVGPIKDQGQCGSCWAFSAIAAVESSIAIREGGSVPVLSEQQLVSCSSAYQNAGCNGGWYYWAWDYMMVNNTEKGSSYPYTSGVTGVDGTCTANTSIGTAHVSSYAAIGTTNADIMAAINVGPVSVAVCAQLPAYQLYKSGVISKNCGTILDHANVAVGYGHDAVSGLDYFLVRNSWGTSWGDNGYLKIEQSPTGDAPGICGINKAVYSVVANSV
jgi:C1A family cysteine protease